MLLWIAYMLYRTLILVAYMPCKELFFTVFMSLVLMGIYCIVAVLQLGIGLNVLKKCKASAVYICAFGILVLQNESILCFNNMSNLVFMTFSYLNMVL